MAEADQTQWRTADAIDWKEVWESYDADTAGPCHPRDWLGDYIDQWAEPAFRVALAVRLHPNTPGWSVEQARRELTAAIQQGYITQGAQGVVWPTQVMHDV